MCCTLLCCTAACIVTGLLYGLLLIPAIEGIYAKAIYTYLDGPLLGIAGTVVAARHFTVCLGDYLGCVKNELAKDLESIWGFDVGVGRLVVAAQPGMARHGGYILPIIFSHEAYRSWAHNPQAGRPPDYFVFSNTRDLPDGVLPDGEPNILLNFDTGTTEHTQRRKLIADLLPALANSPDALALEIPPGLDAAVTLHKERKPGSHLKRAVFDVVGYNLFLNLFKVNISEELAEHFEYDSTIVPAVLGIPMPGFMGRRLAAIRKKILDKVKEGEVGKKFMAAARERGLDPDKRLSEMVWIAMFAGYGGTGNLSFETLKRILGKSSETQKYLVLFRKDPKAFMLEAARLHPPVGGMNPTAYRNHTSLKLKTGAILEAKPGDLAIMWTSGANMDPAVFDHPSEFLPGRKNAMKVLSWNNELDAFASCETVAGCPKAPRGCPGTWLSLRLATAVVSHFLDKVEDSARLWEEAEAEEAERALRNGEVDQEL